MTLRVWAMWKHSRGVVATISILCILNILTYTIIIAYGIGTATIGPSTLPFTGCTFKPSFQYPYVSVIMSISLETLVIALTVIRLSSILRHKRTPLPIIRLLMQDSLVYYIVVVSIHSFVLLVGFFANFTVAIAVFGSLPAIAVAGVACNRMLLRLRSVLLPDKVYAPDIKMDTVDVSARIGADRRARATDVEIWGSTPG
jgi:hypothetical protein